ncbi:alpha/beta hydrolase [Deinococcus maricopensis]|uniref:Alpha/beta hydrolase fold-3 n=1 Tax=Deinococcus maricopensis (strain DSM 21211 / LMG 22137 / NRRL B-23946 / LB-34) TaxID=709986 RepID=E8U840_DEIML|nr:alpha/beta hydrolase [Deinococcus maricopensis]ADV67229.1 alpha/beta hydrolase fold-3 [Deinococcus maricopensis DSM 21211]
MNRPLIAAGLLLGAAVTFTACSPVGALNAVTNTAGLRVTRDLKYGPDVRNVLDVYAPDNARSAPVMLFIHGGSWTSGSKDEYKFIGDSFARAGYVTAVMSYRLAPQNRYPTYIQDAAQALAFLRKNVRAYGGDPDRLFVSGHSAGAFNAVEVVMNERWLREANVPRSAIRAVVGIAGPYAYDYRSFPSRNAFPEGSSPEQTMPDRHVRKDPPPTLLVVAANDRTVAPENATRMEEALRAAGADVTRTVIPKLDHYTIIGSVGRTLTFLGPTRQVILDFLKRHP